MINNAVLVYLNISGWTPHTKDKKASQEVATAKGVKDQSMCRLRKSLFPRTDSLKLIDQIEANARIFHYKHTHAYMRDGWRILTAVTHSEYRQAMDGFKRQYLDAVDKFQAEYSVIMQKARENLGELFDEKDYPGKETIKGRFGFGVSYQPLPASSALYELGFSIEDADEMVAGMEQSLKNSFRNAQNKLWDDLYDKLAKLEFRLQDEKAHIQEASLVALMEYAKTLPKITLFQDTVLVSTAKKLEETLLGTNAEMLKADTGHRQKIREQFKDYLNVANKYRTADHVLAEQEESSAVPEVAADLEEGLDKVVVVVADADRSSNM